MFSLETLNALNARAEREYFARRAAFVSGSFACKWASNYAHGPFTAFVPENQNETPVRFVAILVQPIEDNGPHASHWHFTAHVCPFHPQAFPHEVVIPDTRDSRPLAAQFSDPIQPHEL